MEHVHFINLKIYPGDASIVHDNPQKSLAFLMVDLAENVGTTRRPVVIVHHYNPGSASWSGAEHNAYYDVIKDYNIIGIFCGHSHGWGHYTWKGIDVYNAGTIYSSSFNVIQINDNQMTVLYRRSGSWQSTWTKTIELMQ